MKYLLLIFLLFNIIPTQAKTISNSSFQVRGKVNLVASAKLEQISPTSFIVHEICNNPNGYKTTIKTEEEEFVVTDVKELKKSINQKVIVKLNYRPQAIQVIMDIYE